MCYNSETMKTFASLSGRLSISGLAGQAEIYDRKSYYLEQRKLNAERRLCACVVSASTALEGNVPYYVLFSDELANVTQQRNLPYIPNLLPDSFSDRAFSTQFTIHKPQSGQILCSSRALQISAMRVLILALIAAPIVAQVRFFFHSATSQHP